MDCPSEEQMIRLKLGEIQGIEYLDFDIPNRKLDVIHTTQSSVILDYLAELNLRTTLITEAEINLYYLEFRIWISFVLLLW